jgi:hypothetical protein
MWDERWDGEPRGDVRRPAEVLAAYEPEALAFAAREGLGRVVLMRYVERVIVDGGHVDHLTFLFVNGKVTRSIPGGGAGWRVEK